MQRILQEIRTLTKHSTRDPNMSESAKFDLSDVFQTALRVIKDPAGFYRTMPRDGGYAQPLIFIVVMAVFTGIMMAILSLFGGGQLGGISVGLASVFIIPIMMIIGYSIAAVILFVIWKLMGSTRNYQTAFRCQAFASSILPVTALFSLIPYLGTLASIAWGTWLVINASVEVHGITRQKAMVVFGILGALMMYSNYGSEQMARQMQERAENMDVQLEESVKDMENMTPEEAGKALGEFLKGLEQSTKTE